MFLFWCFYLKSNGLSISPRGTEATVISESKGGEYGPTTAFADERPIYTAHGQTDAALGVFTLTCDSVVGPFTEFPFPRGMDLKIWPILRGGPELTVQFQCARDGTTFEPWGSEDLTNAKAALPIENRTPHEFIKMTGSYAVRAAYSGADAAKPSFVDFAYQLTQSH